MTKSAFFLLLLLLLGTAAACSGPAEAPRPAAEPASIEKPESAPASWVLADPVPLHVPGRSSGTPWVASAGSFVAVAWGAAAEGATDVFLAVSEDGGATFAPPVRVNRTPGEARLGGEFPPRVTLQANGDGLEVVVLWTSRGARTEIKTARSRDGGRTFDEPVTLQAAEAAGDRGWPAVALDAQGVAHAIWLDHRSLASGASGAGHGHHHGGEHDGVAMAQRSGLYYASAREESSGERELTGGVCYCCKTALAAGRDGAIFGAWRHVYPGNIRDMAFTVSRDGGRSFSAPVRVSEDGWVIDGCPDDGPAMAVDAAGAVHLVWSTVVATPEPRGEIRYAITTDGQSFTTAVRIPTLGSVKPSHPQIAIDRGGRVLVAWDENVDGRQTAAMREVIARPGAEPVFGDVVGFTPGSASMYPVLAATDKEIVAVWTTGGAPSSVFARRVSAR